MKTFYARMRVTYYEEWICEAETAEEAKAKLLECDTIDTSELECVDWEIAGSVKEAEEA